MMEASFTFSRNTGRPRRNIDEESLKCMLGLNVPISSIAARLNVSRSTIYTYIKDNEITYKKYSNMLESEIDEEIKKIKKQHPSAGEVMINGHLRSNGIYIQRDKLRKSLHRVDPLGIHERKLCTIKRRKYQVPCPNFIWHIDGTHKLIRWKLVVHAGIDGFSRLIVYCWCSNNNRAETVLTSFQGAVEKYGLPLKVRSDYGGENYAVWSHMLSLRQQYCVILGSSVHNQRIERLHLDINKQVVNNFYNEFMELEKMGLLDPLNATDLFCLHYIYRSKINIALTQFVNAHNNHSISTEQNQTPLQLFCLNRHLMQLHSMNVHDHTSITSLPNTNLLPHVQVDFDARSPLSRIESQRLALFIENQSGQTNIELYQKAIEFVGECLTRN